MSLFILILSKSRCHLFFITANRVTAAFVNTQSLVTHTVHTHILYALSCTTKYLIGMFTHHEQRLTLVTADWKCCCCCIDMTWEKGVALVTCLTQIFYGNDESWAINKTNVFIHRVPVLFKYVYYIINLLYNFTTNLIS